MSAEQQTIVEYIQSRIEKADSSDDVMQQAIAGHTEIRQALDLLPDAPHTFLTGSYDRRTHICPLSNVDIFLVSKTAESDALQVLQTVAEHLQKHLSNDAQIHLREGSIGVVYPHFDLLFDVIPAIETKKGGFRIPVQVGNEFVETHPSQAKRALQEANERCDRLIPLIKLLKQMNAAWARPLLDERGEPILGEDGKKIKPLQSFHLEVMCYSADIDAYPDDCSRFLELVHHLIANVRERTLCAPGGGAPLGAYLDEFRRPWPRDQVVDWLQETARHLSDACFREFNDSHEKTIDVWRWRLDNLRT